MLSYFKRCNVLFCICSSQLWLISDVYSALSIEKQLKWVECCLTSHLDPGEVRLVLQSSSERNMVVILYHEHQAMFYNSGN